MDKENKSRQNDDSLKPVKEAYGFGENQLLNEFDLAQKELDENAKNETALSGYQKILAEIESRGVVPEYHDRDEKKKTVRLKHRWKPLLVAAILGVLMVGVMAVGTYGKKYYRYTSRELNNSRDVRVRNDGENITLVDNIDVAYKEIYKSMGSETMQFAYVPESLKFNSLDLTDEHAILVFTYEGNLLYFTQTKYDCESVGNYKSDCEIVATVKNEWVGKDISVEKNILSNGEFEYKARFEDGECKYTITGKLEQELFVEIVENICPYSEK